MTSHRLNRDTVVWDDFLLDTGWTAEAWFHGRPLGKTVRSRWRWVCRAKQRVVGRRLLREQGAANGC